MSSRQNVLNRFGLVLALAAGILLSGTVLIAFVEGMPVGQAFDKTVGVLMLRAVSRQGATGVAEAVILFTGVATLWLAVWTSMDFLSAGHAEHYFKKVGFAMKIGRMKGHVIICGAGRVGSNIAKSLDKSKQKFLIIEQDEKRGRQMRDRGHVVIIDDCMDEAVLKDAGIEKAAAIAAVVGETERNVYLTLTAKGLNPDIKVYARANDEKIAKKLRAVGADYVVMPEVAGAKDIAKRILKK